MSDEKDSESSGEVGEAEYRRVLRRLDELIAATDPCGLTSVESRWAAAVGRLLAGPQPVPLHLSKPDAVAVVGAILRLRWKQEGWRASGGMVAAWANEFGLALCADECDLRLFIEQGIHKLDDDQQLALLRRLNEARPVQFELSRIEALALVLELQRVWRQPDCGGLMGGMATHWAHGFCITLSANDPELRVFLERGWDRLERRGPTGNQPGPPT